MTARDLEDGGTLLAGPGGCFTVRLPGGACGPPAALRVPLGPEPWPVQPGAGVGLAKEGVVQSREEVVPVGTPTLKAELSSSTRKWGSGLPGWEGPGRVGASRKLSQTDPVS